MTWRWGQAPSSLRICLVANSRFPIREPFVGGLESMTWHLARGLTRRGHRVAVFAAPGSDPRLGVEELRVAPLPSGHRGRLDLDPPTSLTESEQEAYLALLRQLAAASERTYDVVHNNSLHPLPVALAGRLPMPVLTTLHTPPLQSLVRAVADSGGTGSFVAVSQFTAQEWSSTVDCACVPNGVDTDVWAYGAGGPSAVWSGRVVPEKAPHQAIDAARAAGIPLVLAGPVLDRDYFENHVRPRLGDAAAYAGHLRQDELADLVGRSCVAIVTPAWDEPYGLVAAEALACGTPVAAFGRGGLPEVVGRHGRFAPPRGRRGTRSSCAGGRDARPHPGSGTRRGGALHRAHGRPLRAALPSTGRHRGGGMIGWYVHHQGSGHLHRALTAAPHLPGPVTGLSSLPRPAAWRGPWVQLPRDDVAPGGYGPEDDLACNGRLHWVPLHDAGLRGRAHAFSAWVEQTRPAAVVVDQSVEVCVLARLHGIPVIGLTAPGRRDDPAHALGFDVCSGLVGAWPAGLTGALLPGVGQPVTGRFNAVGGCSRFPVSAGGRRRRPGRPRAVLVAGDGGDVFTRDSVERAQRETPGWEWTVMSRRLGAWHPDPAAVLADADVAVIHSGQNSLAEVAALRVPAVVVAAPRPFDEQQVTAAVLRRGWPAVVLDELPGRGWADVLDRAAAQDGQAWEAWCDGRAPERIAAVVEEATEGARAA